VNKGAGLPPRYRRGVSRRRWSASPVIPAKARIQCCTAQTVGPGPPLSRGRRKMHLLARLQRRRPQGLCRGWHHAQRGRPPDDLRRPLFAARGKLCAPADLRPPRSGALCRAARPEPSSPSATLPPASPGRPAGPAARGSLNTNGGGLSYMHAGMYALQGSVHQMRGTAPAQIPQRQDLGLPRRRRHVRRLRHDNHVE
jgi:hypothetical protein